MRVKDKIAMFIGGGSDIATATAVKFIEEGATVILVDYDKSVFERVKDAYAGKEDKVREYVADARKYEEIEAAVEAAMKEFGRIDILVNCAGIGGKDKPFGDVTVAEWDRMLGVNLRGVFLVTHVFFPGMVERRYGRIVNIASQLAYKGAPGLAAYVAAKAGVVGLTRALSYEGAPHNVMVNGIAPGPVETPLLMAHSEAWLDMKKGQLPVGRFGQPDEIAPTALLLASETGGAFYCGQVLSPNGGDVMV